MEGNQGSVHLGVVMRIAIQCSNAAAVFLLLTACAIAQSDKSSAVEIASCEGLPVSAVCVGKNWMQAPFRFWRRQDGSFTSYRESTRLLVNSLAMAWCSLLILADTQAATSRKIRHQHT